MFDAASDHVVVEYFNIRLYIRRVASSHAGHNYSPWLPQNYPLPTRHLTMFSSFPIPSTVRYQFLNTKIK